MARPAGLTWELLSVLLLFAIPVTVTLVVYGENIRRLYGVTAPCLCGSTDLDAFLTRKSAHSVSEHAEHDKAGAASAEHTHVY